jgi:hypothetical protein
MSDHAHGAHMVPAFIDQSSGSGNYGSYTCPSGPSYFYCYYISPGTKFGQGWCESAVNNCDYLSPGPWYWKKFHVYSVATGLQTNTVRNQGWSPHNPSNPSTQTIYVSPSVPVSYGQVAYTVQIETCTTHPHSCDGGNGEYEIGIVVIPGSGSGSGSGSAKLSSNI